MKTTHIIVLVILAVLAVALGLNFADNVSTYSTFTEAKETGRSVHVVGTWVNRENADYNAERDLFQFDLQDSLNTVERVVYREPKPNNFEQAEKVVVVGQYKDKIFEADKIVMKCPSKYEETEIAKE